MKKFLESAAQMLTLAAVMAAYHGLKYWLSDRPIDGSRLVAPKWNPETGTFQSFPHLVPPTSSYLLTTTDFRLTPTAYPPAISADRLFSRYGLTLTGTPTSIGGLTLTGGLTTTDFLGLGPIGELRPTPTLTTIPSGE
jgi:hypothetical protein